MTQEPQELNSQDKEFLSLSGLDPMIVEGLTKSRKVLETLLKRKLSLAEVYSIQVDPPPAV